MQIEEKAKRLFLKKLTKNISTDINNESCT